MILCIGPTPAVQRVMIFRRLALDAVNRAAETLDGADGKSINVTKVLKSLGERPLATGFLGGTSGEYLRSVLESRGIELDFVNVAPRTRQCITLLDESAATHTELVEESQPVLVEAYDKLLAIVARHLKDCAATVMSGTLTPGGPTDFYGRCARMAAEAGILSVVDAQGAVLNEAITAGAGLVKPNRAELSATVGRELADEAAVMAAMRELCERGAQRVVVTAGQAPTLAFDGRNLWRVTSPQIKAVNPIGSGDAFGAGLTCRLLRGDDLGEACRWGDAAGAANALTKLAGEVNREDVERLARDLGVEKVK